MLVEKSRTSIITGVTSGIGEATARAFIEAGIKVIGNGRRSEKLDALKEELGSGFFGVAGDVSQESTIEELFLSSEKQFGQSADIVIANAGRGLGGSVKDADLSQFEDLMKTNVSGTLRLLQKAARKMVDSQAKRFPETSADIVVIGSVVGRHISPFSAVYGASKFAVHSIAEALRREVAQKGVRVSLVEPGVVPSEFQKVAGYGDELLDNMQKNFGPFISTKDVADAILYMVNRPPHVHIGDLVIRPTRQHYP